MNINKKTDMRLKCFYLSENKQLQQDHEIRYGKSLCLHYYFFLQILR